MENAVVTDDQPVAAGLFHSGAWLTDFITPDALEVQALYRRITGDCGSTLDCVANCWAWVAHEVRYEPTVYARIQIHGSVSQQDDYWQQPSLCIRTKVGNCANKAILLTSLLRNILDHDNVHCVLGNLYDNNGHIGGHAWVEVNIDGDEFIMESTRHDVAYILAHAARHYEPVHYFSDKEVLSVPGRTILRPYTACYSDWLKDYLDMAYIEGRK